MALTYGFFDAVYDSDAGTYDRTYSAEQMSLYFKGLVSDGIVPNVGTMFAVTPNSGMTVQVGAGRMFINSRWLQNDSVFNIILSSAHATLNRRDLIIARLDYSNRMITMGKKNGTPAANPTAPSVVRNGTYYEMVLAEIYVGAGVTSITTANITDKRSDTSVCGFVTGLVDQIDTTTMWTQLEAEFDDWFDEMKDQLTDDAAGALQTEIDAVEADVATNTTNISTNAANISTNATAIANLTGTAAALSGVDFNTLTTAGSYKIAYNSANSNMPSGALRGVLEVVKAQDYIVQRYTDFSGTNAGKMFTRVYSGTWYAWKTNAYA